MKEEQKFQNIFEFASSRQASSSVKALRLSKTASKQPLRRPDEPGQPQVLAASADCFYCGCQHGCKELWVNELLYIMLYYSRTNYYCYLVKLLYNIQALLAHTYFDSKKRFSRPISMPIWRHCTSTNHLCGNFWNNFSQLMYFSSFAIYLLKSTSSGSLSQKPISWCIFLAYYINVRNIHQLTIFLKKSQIISKNISSLLMYVRHIIYVSKKDTSRGTNSGVRDDSTSPISTLHFQPGLFNFYIFNLLQLQLLNFQLFTKSTYDFSTLAIFNL